MFNSLEAHVAKAGVGPVDLMFAILLGQSGRWVIQVDRWLNVYGRRRGVPVDAEVARIVETPGIDCDHDAGFENHSELYLSECFDLVADRLPVCSSALTSVAQRDVA